MGSTISPLDDHTARLHRALICTGFGCHFLLRGKKWPRNAPGRSLRGLPYFAALQSKRRYLIKNPQGVLQKKPTRAAGGESKIFWFPSCLKFRLSKRALQGARTLIFACCVHLPCWRFSVKTPTQSLNLQHFAKTWLPCNRFCTAGSQGVLDPLARFLGSFFAAQQRMNIKAGTARREAVRAYVSADNRNLVRARRRNS